MSFLACCLLNSKYEQQILVLAQVGADESGGVRVAGRLVGSCGMAIPASTAARQRCLVVPTYAPHYPLARRLLASLERFATDAASTPIILVFSEPPNVGLPQVCEGVERVCQRLPLEPTSLAELMQMQARDEQRQMADVANYSRMRDAWRADESSAHGPGRMVWHTPATWNTPAEFYTQALKKLLAVRFSRCRLSWVIDSEARAIAPFSFSSVFTSFERRPHVFTVRNAGALSSQWTYLKLYGLGKNGDDSGPNSARLLGITDERQRLSILEDLPRHEDYWMWSGEAMGRLFARVAQLHNGSFLRAYERHPASELALFYAFERFVDAVPAVRIRSVYSSLKDFYRPLNTPAFRKVALAQVKGRSKYRPPKGYVVASPDARHGGYMLVPEASLAHGDHRFAYFPASVVKDRFPHLCELLAHFGYRAMKPNPAWFHPTSEHQHGDGAGVAVRRIRECIVDHGSNHTPASTEPLIIMWLGEREEKEQEVTTNQCNITTC